MSYRLPLPSHVRCANCGDDVPTDLLAFRTTGTKDVAAAASSDRAFAETVSAVLLASSGFTRHTPSSYLIEGVSAPIRSMHESNRTFGDLRWDCLSTASGTISGTIPKARADASCAKAPRSGTGSRRMARRGRLEREGSRQNRAAVTSTLVACPWAHRTLIFRKLKRLEPMITLSVVHWLMGENGWTFAEAPGVVPDPIHGARFLHEIYTRAQPRYTGRVPCRCSGTRRRTRS